MRLVLRGRVVPAAVLFLLLGCGEPSSPGAATPGSVDELADVELSALDESPSFEPGLEAGEVVVRFDGERVSLEAREAPLSEVLQALAVETGTALDVAEAGIEDRRISARIEAARLFDVLSLVLRGVDFELDLAFDAVSQSHGIATLRVRPSADRVLPGALETDLAPDSKLVLDLDLDPDVDLHFDLALGTVIEAMLDSPDREVVLTALDVIGRGGDGAAVESLELLLDDDDPAIREAAARTIEILGGAPPPPDSP